MSSGKGTDHHYVELPLASGGRERAWMARLRADFKLTIISLFGVCAILLVMPFAVFRFIVGDTLIGLGDSALVAVIGLLVVYAWRSGNSQRVGRLMSVTMTAGYLTMVSLFGVSVTWAYPLLLCNFLVADRYVALISSAIVLLVMVLQSKLFPSEIEMWSFLATGMLVSFFGLIFASRTEMQRRQLAELAQRDALTGALNRRALREDLDRALSAFREKGEPLAMAVLDLDHFKLVNDRYGHDEGDRVLVELVEIIKTTLRQQDRVYRIGGEEFVLVLRVANSAGLEAALDKVQAAIRGQLQCPSGPVTVSIGAAMLEPEERIRSWLTRADAALYRAKRAGRNRTEIATAEPAEPDGDPGNGQGTEERWR